MTLILVETVRCGHLSLGFHKRPHLKLLEKSLRNPLNPRSVSLRGFICSRVESFQVIRPLISAHKPVEKKIEFS